MITSILQARTRGPYSKGKTPEGIDLWLDANEGPCVLTDAEVAAAAARACVRRYPDASRLEREIGERLGVAPERVVVTAGGDEAIDRVCRAFVPAGSEVVLATPTFEMIARYATNAGAKVREVRWADREFPARAMVEAITGATSMVAVVSPNNPTGGVARASDLLAIAGAARHAVTLVDLAYTEFADEDLTPLALSLPDAVVVRTFSKAYGLAGLRVGYAVAREEIATALRAAAGPYPVSSVGIEIARAALEVGGSRLSANVLRVKHERERLGDRLREIGARVSPSRGNFVLARFEDGDGVWRGLAERGIAVRRFTSAELKGALRIACPGNERDFERLMGALGAATGRAT